MSENYMSKNNAVITNATFSNQFVTPAQAGVQIFLRRISLPSIPKFAFYFSLTAYHLPLTFSADLKHQPYESKTTFSVGSEFSLLSIVSLRAGYLISPSPQSSAAAGRGIKGEGLSNLTGLGFGVGFKLWSSTIDYSFTPAGELGNTQRLSLSLKF